MCQKIGGGRDIGSAVVAVAEHGDDWGGDWFLDDTFFHR